MEAFCTHELHFGLVIVPERLHLSTPDVLCVWNVVTQRSFPLDTRRGALRFTLGGGKMMYVHGLKFSCWEFSHNIRHTRDILQSVE